MKQTFDENFIDEDRGQELQEQKEERQEEQREMDAYPSEGNVW
jgi:hypothetical protein